MAEQKHTPGPWVVVKGDRGRADGWNVEHASGWPNIAHNGEYPYFAIENEANAHLVAAAPEYHEAAEKMLARHDAAAQRANFDCCGCEDCVLFRPVHAKAEGR